MPCTTYLVRNIGSHGGTPRVYLDLPLLADAGFEPGKTYRRTVDGAAKRITLSLEPNGSYVVSGKTKGDRRLPVIDISSAEALKCRRRSKSEPPCRPNIEPGVGAGLQRAGGG